MGRTCELCSFQEQFETCDLCLLSRPSRLHSLLLLRSFHPGSSEAPALEGMFRSEETRFISTSRHVFISGKRIRFGEGSHQKQFGREWCSSTGIWNLQISSLRDGGGGGMQKSKWGTNVIVWRDETVSSVTQAPDLKHLRNDAFWLTQKYLEQTSFCLSCRSWLLDDAFICEVLNWR